MAIGVVGAIVDRFLLLGGYDLLRERYEVVGRDSSTIRVNRIYMLG
jgi:hypothetical protein